MVKHQHIGAHLVARAPHIGRAPFQVIRLTGGDVGHALTDAALAVFGAHGDAPARERIGQGKGEFAVAAGIGLDVGLPQGGVLVVAARPLQDFHRPFSRRHAAAFRCAFGADRLVVSDEVEAGFGGDLVAAQMVEKFAHARCDFRLQHIHHFIDHAHGQIRRHAAFALKQGRNVEADLLLGFVSGLVGLNVDVELGFGHHQACVFKRVLVVVLVEHRQRHIGRHAFGHGYRQLVLLVRQFFHLHPAARL